MPARKVSKKGEGAGRYPAFIIAAGESTRTRPLTTTMAKPMLPVAGTPIIQHVIEALRSEGVHRVVVLHGHKGREMVDFLEGYNEGTKNPIEMEFIRQYERKGTANAVGQASRHIDSPFLCLNGDIVVMRGHVRELVSAHEAKGANVLGLYPVSDPSRYGIVHLTEDGKVRRIVEKPMRSVSNLANTGLYLFTPRIFDAIDETPLSSRGEYEITDSINILGKKMETVVGYRFSGGLPYIDISVPWDLLSANATMMAGMKDRKVGNVERGATVHGKVHLGKGSVIRSGCYIEGNVTIGENTTIGPNSYIRGYSSIGTRCHIGAGVEIKNSVIMDGSKVPHLTYVGDSVIGPECNLGAGTQVANLRMDDKNVRSYVKGMKVDSGRRKLGAIMGAGVQTGINATILPGTIIGAGAWIGPGAIASGWIGEGARVF